MDGQFINLDAGILYQLYGLISGSPPEKGGNLSIAYFLNPVFCASKEFTTEDGLASLLSEWENYPSPSRATTISNSKQTCLTLGDICSYLFHMQPMLVDSCAKKG